MITRSRSKLAAAAGALAALALAVFLFLPRHGTVTPPPSSEPPAPLAGSESCRSCHAVFFQKWSTSFHGLAMQPHTGDFARDRLTPQEKPLAIGGRSYRAVVGTGADHVEETGPQGRKTHPIVQVLGGKNVCYFLTPLDRGLLQVLPVAYDMNRKEWFSTSGSAVRHFEGVTNEELDWTDRAYTFNTSCFSCHVSQLATNYEPATDSYRTVWAEPGVSCETCHGPAGEHVKAFEGLAPGVKPEGLEDRLGEDALEGAAQRPLRLLPRQGEPALDGVPPRRPLLRPLRPHDAREPRLLPGRARPRRELHAHLVAHEPVREVGPDRLRALPHLERALQVQGPAERRLPALPRGAGRERRRPHAPPRRRPGDALHRLPHAEDRVRAHAAQRPLDAAARARGHARARLAERLQPLPRGPRRGLGREDDPRLGRRPVVGEDPARGTARGGRAQGGLVAAAGDARLPGGRRGATRS